MATSNTPFNNAPWREWASEIEKTRKAKISFKSYEVREDFYYINFNLQTNDSTLIFAYVFLKMRSDIVSEIIHSQQIRFSANEFQLKVPLSRLEKYSSDLTQKEMEFYLELAAGNVVEKSMPFKVKLEILIQKYDCLTYRISGKGKKEGEGKIEKIIPHPNYLKKEMKQTLQYIYVDVQNIEHYLCRPIKYIETTKLIKKNQKSTNPEKKTPLVYIKDIPSYNSIDGTVKFRFQHWDSNEQHRWYINPDCLAGLLGAMIELGIEDLGFKGFSTIDGGSGKSAEHINGTIGDLNYLSTKFDGKEVLIDSKSYDFPRQKDFNIALYKFFWGRAGDSGRIKFLTEDTKLLPFHSQFYNKSRHHNHIHIRGFDFSKIEEQSN
jgi:hypothetical protein